MSCPILPKPFYDTHGLTRRWIKLHSTFKEAATHTNPNILFLGHSLFFSESDLTYWFRYFSKLNCKVFSIRDDRIENLVWRLREDELQNMKPKIVILYIGLNDLNLRAPKIIADGIVQCVEMIRDKLPLTHIIVPAFHRKKYRRPCDLNIDKYINFEVRRGIEGMERVSWVKLMYKTKTFSRSHDRKTKTEAFKTYWGLYQKIISVLIDNN